MGFVSDRLASFAAAPSPPGSIGELARAMRIRTIAVFVPVHPLDEAAAEAGDDAEALAMFYHNHIQEQVGPTCLAPNTQSVDRLTPPPHSTLYTRPLLGRGGAETGRNPPGRVH